MEDGNFLLNHERYDELSKIFSNEQLTNEFKLIRVDPNFRVISTYHPKYKFSKMIDPPFRSRFQSRIVEEISAETKISILENLFPHVDKHLIEKLVIASYSINYLSYNESFKDLVSIPFEFPTFTGLDHLVKILSNFPNVNLESVMERVYPSSPLFKINNESQSKIVKSIFEKSFPKNKSKKETSYSFHQVLSEEKGIKKIALDTSFGEKKVITVQGGKNKSFFSPEFRLTSTFRRVLSDMLQDHAINRDFAIIGSKSSGKSTLINAFCNILGYSIDCIDTITLHNDISFHEIFQKRKMKEDGDTFWEDSVLVKAAKNGGVVIFDCKSFFNPKKFYLFLKINYYHRFRKN